jgi:hypothetical protein
VSNPVQRTAVVSGILRLLFGLQEAYQNHSFSAQR